jgi:hypothetical protein
METLLGVKHLTRKGDYMFNFDMQDGFYALGMSPVDHDFFVVNESGQLYRLAGLSIGWSLSQFYLFKMTMTLVNFPRAPDLELPDPPPRDYMKTYLRRTCWHGVRILPYVDDFLLFPSTEEEALTLRQRTASACCDTQSKASRF